VDDETDSSTAYSQALKIGVQGESRMFDPLPLLLVLYP
jgi:hypothetical protein